MTIFRVPFNLTFTGAGSPGANVWHIRTSGAIGAVENSQANALIGYIRTFYLAVAPYIATGTTIALGTVTEEGTAREIVPSFTNVTGAGASLAPQALAVVVTWKTSIAARRGRGRTFLGPLGASIMQTDGTIVDGSLSTIRTAAGALVSSSLADGNGAIGVWGYLNAKTPGKENPRNPADGRVLRDVTGYQIRDLFGVLRSRRD